MDSLRLEVGAAAPVVGGRFQVLVQVNGVEMTTAGAGLGMDPYDILVPTNRLVAGPEPSTVPIARCTCGGYGCGSTDVTITRDGKRVRWEWSKETPMDRAVSFDAKEYDNEVARLAADHTWETPERTAGRLVLSGMDWERLPGYGLKPSWVANHHRDPEVFRVALQVDSHQVFVDTPWNGRTPEELAREACATLALPPDQWRASWRVLGRGVDEPPWIAGPQWRREGF